MENDAFIQNHEFSMGSAGRNSMLMISSQKLRIIVYDIFLDPKQKGTLVTDKYKNYPKTGNEIVLNKVDVYYLDIPLKEIKSVTPITHNEAGGFFLLGKNIFFGIRIKTKQGNVYDLDTTMSSAYCTEINSHLLKSENTNVSDEVVNIENS